MATFKALVQRHHKKNDGTYNIKIRLFHNGKVKYISTAFFITDKELTKNLAIKSQQIKDDCENIIRGYRAICNENGTVLPSFSADEVFDLVTKKQNLDERIDFIAFAEKTIEKLRKNNKYGTASSYLYSISALKKFIKKDFLLINDITASFLRTFYESINGERAKSLYLSNIRGIHNLAKGEYNDEDRGIIAIPYSPFSKFKVPKSPMAKKRAVSIETIQKIIDLPYKEENKSIFNLAKDVYLLSFCTFGTNSVDLFTATSYVDGRLIYQRQKTKNRREDKAEISIKIEHEIKDVFNKYRDESGRCVFNFYKRYSTAAVFNATINKGMKAISDALGMDKIDFYSARHSWATIARNKAGISKDDIDLALNHVDNEHRMADKYIERDWSVIDKANRRVLELFNFNSKYF